MEHAEFRHGATNKSHTRDRKLPEVVNAVTATPKKDGMDTKRSRHKSDNKLKRDTKLSAEATVQVREGDNALHSSKIMK